VSFDSWKQTAPEEWSDPPPPCKVCTGEGDETCGEECSELAARCDRERKIRGHYLDAWRALQLAREYRIGDATSDFRVKAIVRRVQLIRVDIADLRKAS
jgi:hypothetical protein